MLLGSSNVPVNSALHISALSVIHKSDITNNERFYSVRKKLFVGVIQMCKSSSFCVSDRWMLCTEGILVKHVSIAFDVSDQGAFRSAQQNPLLEIELVDSSCT